MKVLFFMLNIFCKLSVV